MSKRDDEIRERIMGDEDFGPQPGDEAKAALVGRFRTERKRLLVRMTIWVLIGMGICMWGGYALAHISNTRAMLAALFTMLVGFESTVLIKLWYWTADSKAAVMEQIQRLGLRVQGVAEPVGEGPPPYDRISMRWLRCAASGLILAAGVAFGVWVLVPLFRSNADVVYRAECHAVLDADGTAHMTGRTAFTYYGVAPLTAVRVPTAKQLQGAVWTDAAGRDLPNTQQQTPDGWVSLVQLSGPLFRKEAADLRVRWTIPRAVSREGGVWSFVGDGAWHRGLWPQLPLTWNAALPGVGVWSEALSTVKLPRGAQFMSARPERGMIWSDHTGCRTVMFHDLQQVHAGVDVRYTLPEGGAN